MESATTAEIHNACCSLQRPNHCNLLLPASFLYYIILTIRYPRSYTTDPRLLFRFGTNPDSKCRGPSSDYPFAEAHPRSWYRDQELATNAIERPRIPYELTSISFTPRPGTLCEPSASTVLVTLCTFICYIQIISNNEFQCIENSSCAANTS